MKLLKIFRANPDAKTASVGILNWFSIIVVLFGIFIVILFGTDASSKATIFLWMVACLLGGTAVGFLFGVPKILQNNQVPGATSGTQPTYQQQVNTNLTEISDWLTKIIVGLGLVNLTKIPPYLAKLAQVLAGGITTAAKPPSPLTFAFAYGTIIAYAVLGFLFGYIMTRLYLASAFARADEDALRIATRKAEDAEAAANSALQKAEFALVKPSEVPQNNNQSPEQKLDDLAQTYVRTRSAMPSGKARTTRMGEIFKSMIEVSREVENFPVTEKLQSDDNGQRLTGYAYLYDRPNHSRLANLIEALVTDTTPFGQYWAIQALGKILSQQPGMKLAPDLYEKIKTYYNSLPKGIDREYELRKLFPDLNRKP